MSEIVERFKAVCRDEPRRPLIALPATRTTLTAEDVWRQHLECIRHLRGLGLGPGDLLVCGAGNRPELIAVMLAARALDVTLMAVDAGATDAEVRSLCGRFGARAILTSTPASFADCQVAVIAPGLAVALCEAESVAYPGAAMLKLTSGSTGLPRAARTTEAQLIADGIHIMASMGIGPDDTQLAVIPLAHAYGLGVIVMPLLLQGTAMILRESFIPPHVPLDAREFGARRLPGVPFMFEYLAAHPPAGGWPAGLTRLVSAGARLSPLTMRAFHERFGLKIHTFYGTTETGGITFDDSDEVEAVTVGRPLAGVSLSLRPMDGLPPECGRVHVVSDAVCDGYVGPEAGDFTEGGFLAGDYGTLDEDGRLTLIGRVSSFINVAGRKVQPDEVEAVLRELPAIADVRVVGASDAQRGQQVVACVVTRAGTAPTTLEIRQFCAIHLAAQQGPRRLIFLEAIPLTSRGKTDRAALDDLVQRRLDQDA